MRCNSEDPLHVALGRAPHERALSKERVRRYHLPPEAHGLCWDCAVALRCRLQAQRTEAERERDLAYERRYAQRWGDR